MNDKLKAELPSILDLNQVQLNRSVCRLRISAFFTKTTN